MVEVVSPLWARTRRGGRRRHREGGEPRLTCTSFSQCCHTYRLLVAPQPQEKNCRALLRLHSFIIQTQTKSSSTSTFFYAPHLVYIRCMSDGYIFYSSEKSLEYTLPCNFLECLFNKEELLIFRMPIVWYSDLFLFMKLMKVQTGCTVSLFSSR